MCWLTVRNRLTTRDRALFWGYTGDSLFMFCRNSIESSDHIYSLCSFTQGIWERVMHIYLVNNPLYCWDGVIDGGIRELQTRNFRASIHNLALAATVYYVWLQRNARIYKGHIKPEEGIFFLISRLKKVLYYPLSGILKQGCNFVVR